MKKQFKVLIVLMLFLGMLIFCIGPADLDAGNAICRNKSTGDTCEGECCKTTLSGCMAGPCDVILK